MCTVSIISTGPSAFRLVTNRDEQRTRAPAKLPRWRSLGNGRAIWPTDTAGGGTWIGASESGLVLCILNKSIGPQMRLPDDLRSRGLIIPELIDAGSAHDAMHLLETADLSSFAPFRVIACEAAPSGRVRILEREWDRRTLGSAEHETPVCFASSGLGDAKVLPRLPLFDRCVREGDAASQDRFHHHRWPGHPEISVLMSRPDARTRSITTIDVDCTPAAPRVDMHMTPIHETAEAPPR